MKLSLFIAMMIFGLQSQAGVVGNTQCLPVVFEKAVTAFEKDMANGGITAIDTEIMESVFVAPETRINSVEIQDLFKNSYSLEFHANYFTLRMSVMTSSSETCAVDESEFQDIHYRIIYHRD